jgi:hypothetical protein
VGTEATPRRRSRRADGGALRRELAEDARAVPTDDGVARLLNERVLPKIPGEDA